MQYVQPNSTFGGSWDTSLHTGINKIQIEGWLPPGPSVTSGTTGPIVVSGNTATIYMNGVHSSFAGSWQLFAARATGTCNYSSGSPVQSGWQNQFSSMSVPLSGFMRGNYTFPLTSGFGSNPAVVTGPKGQNSNGTQIYCTGTSNAHIDFLTMTTGLVGGNLQVISEQFSFAVFDW